MSPSLIRILAVDDEPDICALSKDFLEMSEAMEVETACSVSEARAALGQRHFDVIVSDYQMPEEDGIQFLKSLRAAGDRTPFILFTGKGREEVVIEALNAGADSYLQKDGKPTSVYTELEHHIRAGVQRYRAEDALIEREKYLRAILQTTVDGFWTLDAEGNLMDVNETYCRMSGYTRDELLRLCISDLDAVEERAETAARVNRIIENGSEIFETRHRRKNGSVFDVEVSVTHIVTDGDRLICFCRDITERKRAEATLADSFVTFKTVMDGLDSLVYVADMETYEILFINNYGGKIWGDIAGTICWKSLQADQNGPCQFCTNERLLDSDGNPAGILIWEFRNTITGRWFECHDSAIRWTDGRIVRIEIATDITERKRAEEALLESEKKYRLLVESAAEVILVAQDGMIRLVNPAAIAMTGLSEQELMSKPFPSFVHPDDRAMVVESYQRRLRGEAVPARYAFRLLAKDGSIKWVEIGAVVIEWEGRPATLNFLMDITERKRVEEALRGVNRKLNILSNVTRHDIINQLMALERNLTLLENRQSDHAFDEHLRKAEAAAKRISTMIRFTKEYQDIGVHSPLWQDVRVLIDTGMRHIMPGAIKVVNDVPAGIEMFADPLITKVFHNLINNSMRHGGNITTIRFSVEEVEGAHVIICEDDGVGISADMKEKLFTQGSGKDHGYGLFLSREILDITGITITEAGALGRGARFVITTPASGLRGPRTDGS